MKWFGHYADKDAKHLEQAIERFAPGTKGATSLDEYFDQVVAKVTTSLQKHVATGTIEDVPAEIIDKKHEPQDFLHIALDSAKVPAQLSCIFGNENGGGGQQQEVDLGLEQLYNDAEKIGVYTVAKLADYQSQGPVIIKLCPGNEHQWYRTFSGVNHFPRFIAAQGNYCVLAFIGNYPEPAPHLAGGQSSEGILGQLVEICVSISEHSVYHGDMDNNLMLDSGQVKVIDLNPMQRLSSFNQALTNNAEMAKRLVAQGSHEQFDDMINQHRR